MNRISIAVAFACLVAIALVLIDHVSPLALILPTVVGAWAIATIRK